MCDTAARSKEHGQNKLEQPNLVARNLFRMQKIANYNGTLMSLVLLEEHLAIKTGLKIWECSCGSSFVTVFYASFHCEKKHAGELFKDRIQLKKEFSTDNLKWASFYTSVSQVIMKTISIDPVANKENSEQMFVTTSDEQKTVAYTKESSNIKTEEETKFAETDSIPAKNEIQKDKVCELKRRKREASSFLNEDAVDRKRAKKFEQDTPNSCSKQTKKVSKIRIMLMPTIRRLMKKGCRRTFVETQLMFRNMKILRLEKMVKGFEKKQIKLSALFDSLNDKNKSSLLSSQQKSSHLTGLNSSPSQQNPFVKMETKDSVIEEKIAVEIKERTTVFERVPFARKAKFALDSYFRMISIPGLLVQIPDPAFYPYPNFSLTHDENLLFNTDKTPTLLHWQKRHEFYKDIMEKNLDPWTARATWMHRNAPNKMTNFR